MAAAAAALPAAAAALRVLSRSVRLHRAFLLASVQILDSLVVLRDSRIIHCDLKPENVLLKNVESGAWAWALVCCDPGMLRSCSCLVRMLMCARVCRRARGCSARLHAHARVHALLSHADASCACLRRAPLPTCSPWRRRNARLPRRRD